MAKLDRDTALSALCMLAAALLGALAGAIQVGDVDVWMHLAGGRLILESGLPASNTFSATFPDHPWKDPEWGYDLLTALFHSLMGWPGVSLLQALFLGAAFALCWDSIRRQARAPLAGFLPLGGALLLLILAASRFRFNHRPEDASLLGMALLLNLFERNPRRLPLFLFLAGAAWANLHPGFLLGLPICLAFAAEGLLKGKDGEPGSSLLAALAFLAGSFVNPYLAYPHLYVVQNIVLPGALPITELGRPSLSGHPALFLLIAITAASLPSAWRRRDWTCLLLVLLFLPAAFFAQRLIPLFCLVAAPGIARSLQEARESFPPGGRALAALGVLLLASTAALGWREAVRNRVVYPPGWGVDWRQVPRGATRIIRERCLEGPIYNEYAQGSFLMEELWPRIGVYQDSRTFAYPLGFLRESILRDLPGLKALLERRGINLALIEWNPDLGDGYKSELFRLAGWNLVFLDGCSRMFVRPGSPDAGKTPDLVFHLIRADADDRELVEAATRHPAEAREELARIDPAALRGPFDFQRFGAAAVAAGDPAMGERFLRRGVGWWPGKEQLRFNLSLALLAQGKAGEAGGILSELAEGSGNPAMRKAARSLLQR